MKIIQKLFNFKNKIYKIIGGQKSLNEDNMY